MYKERDKIRKGQEKGTHVKTGAKKQRHKWRNKGADREKEQREIRKRVWSYRNVYLSEGRGSVRYFCKWV